MPSSPWSAAVSGWFTRTPFCNSSRDSSKYVRTMFALNRVDAAKRTGRRLIIAGRPRKGCDEYWDSIREKIGEDVDRGRIVLKIEYVPDEATELYFKAADVLILPTNWPIRASAASRILEMWRMERSGISPTKIHERLSPVRLRPLLMQRARERRSQPLPEHRFCA